MPRKKENEKSDESTHDRLLNAAAIEFAEHGFNGASIRNICREAKVNIASVSYYFGSKEKLYFEVHKMLNVQVSAMLNWMAEPIKPMANWDEWEERFAEIILDLVQDKSLDPLISKCRKRIFCLEMAHPSKCFDMLMETFYTPVNDYLCRMFKVVATNIDPKHAQRLAWNVILQLIGLLGISPEWEKFILQDNMSMKQWSQINARQIASVIRKELQTLH